jgi:hypothetical protein
MLWTAKAGNEALSFPHQSPEKIALYLEKWAVSTNKECWLTENLPPTKEEPEMVPAMYGL